MAPDWHGFTTSHAHFVWSPVIGAQHALDARVEGGVMLDEVEVRHVISCVSCTGQLSLPQLGRAKQLARATPMCRSSRC